MHRKIGSRILDRITVEQIGFVLALTGLAIVLWGHITQYGGLNPRLLFDELYANLGSEMASIALTILIIDRLNQRREQRQHKRRLIREMGSRDSSTALRAVDELRASGWLTDGSLVHADLKYANLEDAILDGADLRSAYLTFANLRRADLRSARLEQAILRQADLQEALLLNADLRHTKLLDANLQHAKLQGAQLAGASLVNAQLKGARGLTDDRLAECARLQNAVMPNGTRYDGRYNLPGDLEGHDPNDAAGLAEYYGVSLEAYRRGQAWRQHRQPSEGMDASTNS